MKDRTKDLALACVSGVLLFLCFPTFHLTVLAWVGLVPLLIALEGKSLKAAFLLSFVAVMVFFTGAFFWIWSVKSFNFIDYALLAAYSFPVYGGAFGLTLNWVRQRTGLSQALIAPPLWAGLEFLRGHAGFLSAPWVLLGHSQYLNPSLIQIASFTGVAGLTFLIVLVNAALAEAIQYARQRWSASPPPLGSPTFSLVPLLLATILLSGTYLYGLYVLSHENRGAQVKIAALHGNIPQEQKWDIRNRQPILEQYVAATRRAAEQSPELIVWPETALAGDVEHDSQMQGTLERLAIETNAFLLVGSAENGKFNNPKPTRKIYNSMILFSPKGKIDGRYRKIRLVPFGEYEPLRGIIKWPKAVVAGMNYFSPGEDFTLFPWGQATYGSVICWESTFPELFREFAKRGARFMVNASNEALFGEAAPYHFLAMAAFRAAENRVAIVRSTNRGISGFIDPFGRITEQRGNSAQEEGFVGGILIGQVSLSENGTTFYTRFGDVFAYFLILICGALLFQAGLQGRTPILSIAKLSDRR